MDRIRTGEGRVRDFEKNVLELCREAFDEEESLKWEGEFRPAPQDFEDMNILDAKISNLPVLYAWCDDVGGDANQTGAQLGRAQRNKEDYIVVVVYATNYGLSKEGHRKIRLIGDRLKKKLTQNTDVNGLANMGGELVGLNFDPDFVVDENDTLVPVRTARIIMKYSLVEKQVRAQNRR